MCQASYPVSRRAFHLGIVIFHISNRGCKNEIGVIFIIIHTYVGKTTGGYWEVLGDARVDAIDDFAERTRHLHKLWADSYG